MTEEEHTEQLREQQNWEDQCAQQELHAAVVGVFGGVGAMSPELYEEALRRVAEQCGRVVDDTFRHDVTQDLRQMPCPLDLAANARHNRAREVDYEFRKDCAECSG